MTFDTFFDLRDSVDLDDGHVAREKLRDGTVKNPGYGSLGLDFQTGGRGRQGSRWLVRSFEGPTCA